MFNVVGILGLWRRLVPYFEEVRDYVVNEVMLDYIFSPYLIIRSKWKLPNMRVDILKGFALVCVRLFKLNCKNVYLKSNKAVFFMLDSL